MSSGGCTEEVKEIQTSSFGMLLNLENIEIKIGEPLQLERKRDALDPNMLDPRPAIP